MRIVFSSLGPAFSPQVSVCVCYPFTTERRYVVHHPALLQGRRELHSQAQLLTGLVHLCEKGNLEPGGRGPHPGTFLRPSSTITQRALLARVYEIFDDGRGSTYLVMEFLSAPSFEVLINAARSSPEYESLRATAITKIADVVEWSLKCPVPEGDSIGPVGGGNIQHIFFNMEEAPVAFATSGALEAYVNMVRSRALCPGVFRVNLAVGIVVSTWKNQAQRPNHNRSSPLFPLGRRFQELPLGRQSGLIRWLATREPPPAIFRQLLLP